MSASPYRSRRLACLLLATALAACQGGSSAVSTEQGATVEQIPILDSPHIPYIGVRHAAYNSVPPTSGPHTPWTVAAGIYRDEIPEELQVHALEHGRVLIQYAPGTEVGQVRLLEGFARQYVHEVIVCPYGRLTSGVALTAWGRLERLDRAEPESIQAFIEMYAGAYEHGWRRQIGDD